MKFIKSLQKVLIIILAIIVVSSCIFIIKLEIKAANLQTQWEEHQKSLKKNEDVLQNLKIFSRFVKKNTVKVDDNNILLISGDTWFVISNEEVNISTKGKIELGGVTDNYLGFDSQKKLTYLSYKGSQVSAGNITVGGKKYDGVLVRSSNGGTQLVMTDKGLSIAASGTNDEYRFELKPSADVVILSKGNSEFKLEKDNLKIKVDGNIEIGPSSDRYMGYNVKEDRFYIHHSGSELFLGPIYDKQ